LKRNSEDVSRKFRLVNMLPPGENTVLPTSAKPVWSADSYEYAWYTSQQTGGANIGVLIFNPRGHNEILQTSTGPRPFSARVAYTIFDNHIVRDDRVVPNQAPYDIKLSLPFALTHGDILKDQTAYSGMFRGADDADLIIQNVNTGEEIGQIKGGA